MKTRLLQNKFSMKVRVFSFMMLLLVLTMGAKANPVDMKTARKAAQSFLYSRMGSNPEIELIDFTDKASFSNFYVFGNGHCFVIIAADNCVHPVLGYSVKNAFGTDAMPENVAGWLRAYNEDAALAVASKMEATDDIKAEWANLLSGKGLTPKSRRNVEPLVRTTWGQSSAPYNNLCPADPNGPNGHTHAGCMATCMAQIMNYWEHPIRGVGSHSYILDSIPEYGELYADFGATVYDWDHMRNNYSNDYTDAEANAVATLMYHCGVAVDMIYGPNNSGAYGKDEVYAYKTYFDYNPNIEWIAKTEEVNGGIHVIYSDEQWIGMLKNELDLMRPVPYGGNTIGSGGHAFICDGYDENNFFHFNWGWDGGYDGYYILGALNPGSMSFNDINDALFYCFPNTPSINPPTNVVTTVSGRNVNIQWSGESDASSYKLYRNGDLLASNLTSTSYTDNNLLYGTYFYYVKSVMADGTTSLMSDSSIAEVVFPGPVPINLQSSVNDNNVNLSWTAPTFENVTLNYGDGPVSHYWSSSNTYFAHRYLSSDLNQYQGKRVSKIEIYIAPFPSSGAFTAYVFTNSNSIGKPDEHSLSFESDTVHFASAGWNEIILNDTVIVSGDSDLWVVIKQENNSIPGFDLQEYNANACYWGYSSPTELYPLNTNLHVSWFINVELTDGIYTYNLHRNNTVIANEITESTYQDSNLLDDHYVYYVTTNYYGGESDASNEVEVLIGNPQYTILATASPSIGGTISGEGTFGYGQTCTLTATANTDYLFLNWTEDSNVVSTNATYSFLAESNRNLKANFVPQYCQISLSSSNGGSVSGGGIYGYGQSCTLTAVPNVGYLFTEWTKDGEQVSTDATFTFVVTANATYTANFSIAPSGALNGLFSVGNSKQVQFSQGNLQYQASTDTWRFAPNQYDYIGINNRNISPTNTGWIDLFGWGTSGWDNGNTDYHPWDIDLDNNGTLFGPPGLHSLIDDYSNADWGVYNPIINGGNQTNKWRCLTHWEWQYVFNIRSTSSGVRYAKAQVNGVNGLILVPDDWSTSIYELQYANIDTVSFNCNTICLSVWLDTFEPNGAVFLPAAGMRYYGNKLYYLNSHGLYWSSTCHGNLENYAINWEFSDQCLYHYSGIRAVGMSVRLVRDVITQTVTLSEGTNWFSTYLDITLEDLKAALVNALGTGDEVSITIKSQTQNVKFRNGRWIGQLSALDMARMYTITVNEGCEITLEGLPVDVSALSVTISSGVNWIAFPFDQSVTPADFFGTFPVNDDVIKSQIGNTRYVNGRWVGQLTTLEPGKGYIYNSADAEDRIFIFPTNVK